MGTTFQEASEGIAEQIALTSDGSTANMHFLIKESSFNRRLSIRALYYWFSARASSTFYKYQTQKFAN
jgi:hypothetical protein